MFIKTLDDFFKNYTPNIISLLKHTYKTLNKILAIINGNHCTTLKFWSYVLISLINQVEGPYFRWLKHQPTMPSKFQWSIPLQERNLTSTCAWNLIAKHMLKTKPKPEIYWNLKLGEFETRTCTQNINMETWVIE